MVQIGTPLTAQSTRVVLLGSGELGKELTISLQRLGVEVIAVDRYANAPAMQVAHRSHVINMLDPEALRSMLEKENPDFVVPEIEAIATPVLQAMEAETGMKIIPTARAVRLTMDREGIRKLAAETLGLPVSAYEFADDIEHFEEAVRRIGFPCIVKPVMSSSGKGQSMVRSADEIAEAWDYAQSAGRAGAGRVIVEAFVKFDYEITLLTVRSGSTVRFCAPIGHEQVDGDYRFSWQPQEMSDTAMRRACEIAEEVTGALGGNGLFGVELFVCGDEVLFSEVSPRPHDTGMVTMASQWFSEFDLHARALLGLPVPEPVLQSPAVSAALLVEGEGAGPVFSGLEDPLNVPGVDLRLFGKPEVRGRRRMGVILARGETVREARNRAQQALDGLQWKLP